MKILYISRSAFGVMGEAAISNYVRVVSKHHEVHVAETPWPTETSGAAPDGVRVHTLPLSPTKLRRHALFDLLRAVKPDIVHLVQSPNCYDDILMLQPVLPSAAWCLDFRSPHVGDPDAPIIARFHDAHLQVDCLMTHAQETLRTNLPDAKRKAVEIPPGVDIDSIAQVMRTTEKRALAATPRRLVYLGSLSKTRLMEDLIDMIADAHRHLDGVGLDIFGQGNAKEDMKAQIDVLGLHDVVTFKGQLPQKDLWAELTKYDAGVAYVPHPLFATAPSLKSIEYAAVGIPVLASNTIGHRAFARRHNFDFNLFENEPSGLTACLRALETKPWTPARIAANHAACQKLGWDRIIEDRLLPVYDRLRKKHRA